MKIALYFGSFSPLHIGHMAICRYLTTSTEIDKLRLVVSPGNPLKERISIYSSLERLNSVKEGIKRGRKGKKVEVSDIEYKMVPPYYTINTLRKFQEEEPDNQFILVIGADNLAIIERWHLWQELLKEFEVWVYPRGDIDSESLCEKYGCKLIRAPLIDISSTEIREAQAQGVDMDRFIV